MKIGKIPILIIDNKFGTSQSINPKGFSIGATTYVYNVFDFLCIINKSYKTISAYVSP